ncbi:hypothetical protein JTE90_020512 [Oedothorax gibbosus]|uniref:ISXO2-like transposase domain-containing protein n=1 Tax=Oedothorax gibbosus TaxID=931172 RepID=A0AAV6TKB6_9ARAC|nr:hypothetical protein JTE90_020512 [Oedothorax gibbosus]
MAFWNLDLLSTAMGTERRTILAFCTSQGLLPTAKFCSENHPMVLYEQEGKVGVFRCRKKHQTGKDEKKSRADCIWFSLSKLPAKKIIYLSYCFSLDYSYDLAIRETSCLISKTSTETVADWYSSGREIVVAHLLDRQAADGPIGGAGKIVEIDESKFGKRKYNVGHVVEGSWVLGMYERDSKEFRLEVLLSGLGDPITGAHTQTIESNWRTVKHHLRQSGQPREKLADRLLEFLWRRELRLKPEDPFNAFLEVVKQYYPVATAGFSEHLYVILTYI